MELKRYDIHLDVDFDSSGFKGNETIEIDGAADELSLDSADIEITSVEVDSGQCSWSYDIEGKKLTVGGRGFRKVKVAFAGKALEGGLHGFYKSSYNGGYFLSTQFEPVGARNVFPCLDDPSKKAVFSISIRVGEGLSVISNMPVAREERSDGSKTVTFEDTPRMSTYLLFAGIGRFEEQRLPGGFEVIVASAPNRRGKGEFAIVNGRLFLSEYERYYSIPYPLEKLHLVAVPEFAVGAMENWGAITFREVALLVDESTSVSNKRLIASVLAHEIAHQWFGNLVTMKWWNDLWLNESFATYMSSVIVDRIYPDWEVWSDFLTSETSGAMVGDSLKSTHPIEVEVGKPEEINQIFDEISYGKGASVLRMVASYIGEESFRNGVNAYLKKFSYSNAKSSDLWESLEKSSSEPVGHIMKEWVGTAGFPVITARYDKGGIRLTQERFLLGGSGDGKVWPIPIQYMIDGKKGRLLMTGREALIEASSEPTSLNLNAGQTGFYRVEYDRTLHPALMSGLHHMEDAEKYGIVSDLYYFLLSGRADINEYLAFVRLLEEDSSYIVVSGIAGQLGRLKEIVPENEELSSAFRRFYRGQLRRIGTDRKEGENENSAVLRERLTEGLAMYDDEFASEHAKRFESMFEQAAELRGSVGIAYARSVGEQAFDPLVDKMKNASSDADSMKALLGLASFKDPALVGKVLELAFSGTINKGHISYMVYMTAVNPEGKDRLWSWFVENRDRLFKTYAGTGMNGAMTETVIARAGIGKRAEVEEYFARNSIPEADMGIAKGLELLGVYSQLRERYAG